MPSNHLILCCPLLLPSVFPSIRVFSSESVLHIRWPKYSSFSFSISPSNAHSGLISFRMDWLDFLGVQGTLKSLPQHHSLKASILLHSAFFIVQLLHPYMTTGKTIDFDRLRQIALWYKANFFTSLICVPVTQSCLTLCDPMDCSLPGSSVHGISKARILKCVTLLKGIFPTQGSKPHLLYLLHLLHWQVGFFFFFFFLTTSTLLVLVSKEAPYFTDTCVIKLDDNFYLKKL